MSIKKDIYKLLDKRTSFNMFGLVNVTMLRDELRSKGYKKIPTPERIKKIVTELFGDEMVNISFSCDKKKVRR